MREKSVVKKILLKGQWRPGTIRCILFGHKFVNPGIMAGYKQVEWKCFRCGLEVDLKFRYKEEK